MDLSNFKVKWGGFGALLCVVSSLSSCSFHSKTLYGDNDPVKNPYYESEINQTEYELDTKTNRSRGQQSMGSRKRGKNYFTPPINITLNTSTSNQNEINNQNLNQNRQEVVTNTTCCCSLPCSCCCCSIFCTVIAVGIPIGVYFAGISWGWWNPIVGLFIV